MHPIGVRLFPDAKRTRLGHRDEVVGWAALAPRNGALEITSRAILSVNVRIERSSVGPRVGIIDSSAFSFKLPVHKGSA